MFLETTYLVDCIMSICNNQVTLEQYKLQKLCVKEIFHQDNSTSSHILVNIYLSQIDLTIFRISGEKLTP